MCVLQRMGLLNSVKVVQTFEVAFSFLVHVSGFQNMLEMTNSHLSTFLAVGECWKLGASFELMAFVGQASEYPSFCSLVTSFNCCQLMLASC